MEHHPVYGVSAPERGWVPAPRYLLRRDRILRFLRPLTKGRVLEIGCGAGALLNDLISLGFNCTALEPSADARDVAHYLTDSYGGEVQILEEADSSWNASFDYVMAFEVLEHIENERAILEQWLTWLKPGGYLLLSVPAHQKWWNATDTWAGHYRRYERDQLIRLLQQVGLTDIRIECYGVPLSNILEPVRAHYHARQLAADELPGGEEERKALRSKRSGVERPLEVKSYHWLTGWPGKWIMQAAFGLQKLFINSNWGTGYLALARRNIQTRS